MLKGRTITIIKPIGGLVAGQQKQYELWTQGGIITITNKKEVEIIDKTLKDAKRLNVNEKEYLLYMINEEGILN